jgi:hypothetical protein
MPMTRRNLLHWGAAACAVQPLLGCGPVLRDVRCTSMEEALREMQHLLQTRSLTSRTVWSWPQTLEHLAQSIEYSMSGYPAAKSALFQDTLGRTAFRWFAWRGQMHHDLTEPIPGSPVLSRHLAVETAALRLIGACQQFAQWTGPLQPHFAYGSLSHSDYEQAHAMHLANHFAAFSV